MPIADPLLLATALAAVIDWIAVGRGIKPLEWIAKPATLALLLLWAAAGPAPSWALLAALTCSLLGDVYLMLPANLFAAGLGAFLLGHLGYIAALDAPLVARLAWFAAVVALSAPLTLRLIRGVSHPLLRGAVASYMLVIAFMVASALASGDRIAALGAVLFMISDAMIAWRRFVAPFPGARVAIHVTYHVGQLLLVWALRG